MVCKNSRRTKQIGFSMSSAGPFPVPEEAEVVKFGAWLLVRQVSAKLKTWR